MRITRVRTWILDIPFHQPATLSYGTSATQSFVIVQVDTDEGLVGLGEAPVLGGGPYWNEETPETIKTIIDRYVSPVVIGENPLQMTLVMSRVEYSVKGNYFAKSAIEIALHDIIGRYLEQPIHTLFGGMYRQSIDLSWTLATGDASAEIDEAAELWDRGHRIFKFKVGSSELDDDVARIRAWREAFPTATVRVDANQGWDERTTLRACSKLSDLDIDMLEQPIPRSNLDGMARIRDRIDIPLMADESVCMPDDMVRVVRHGAADAVSLKPSKSGGLRGTLKVAAIAEGAQLAAYVGCMRETSIGTAAYAHVAASVPGVTLGCELFGPLMLAADIARNPVLYENGSVVVPTGPGLGVDLDTERLESVRRRC